MCMLCTLQDTVLFNDTIYRNIAYGRPSASREEVLQAAGELSLAFACLLACIAVLPEWMAPLSILQHSGVTPRLSGPGRLLVKDSKST